MSSTSDVNKPFAVHLLDVGLKEYGDALLCRFGDVSVLIDGAHTGDQDGTEGHESIPDQVAQLLGQSEAPYRVTLLVVTHSHEDHIGCLPYLVAKNLLVADYALVADPLLGWGRTADDGSDTALLDDSTRQVLAGLREEIRTKGTDDQTLAQFLADAASLEDRYKQMLDTLEQKGAKVFRHGRDNPQALLTFLQGKDVDLKILGPSQDQLALCAERIRQATDDAIVSISDAFRSDESLDAVTLYREFAEAADAVSRPGAAVNLQSIVTCFTHKNKKFLFAGDMQFEEPQVNGADSLISALREKVKAEGPFAFVKLGHHGSFNAFSEAIYQELNENGRTKLFGICAGEQSTAHPNPATLQVLQSHKSQIKWARTDHNKQSTFSFSQATPKVTIEQGRLNDPKPNTSDIETAPEVEPATGTVETVKRAIVTTAKSEMVEVTARIPHATTKVILTIEVQPQATAAVASGETTTGESDRLPTLRIAGGRQLPSLLFVTSKERLARNIGQREADHLLQSLRAQNALLFDEIPTTVTEASQAAELVRQKVRQNSNTKGVVLLGGYDVIPSQRVDCLPPALATRVSRSADADNFIVWSDDVYGDTDGDLLPELAVSRIPDGNRAGLVFAAIQATGAAVGKSRVGMRNIARPFADNVFRSLPGSSEMLVSRPITCSGTPRYSLSGDRVYIMLHGDYTDSSRFWGEETENNVEAINMSNLPARSGAVVFTGCCWGALTVNTPAGRVVAGRSFGQKSPDDSLAMSFLKRGALAFIGCTGSHYSPLEAPYEFFGGPMHEAFWQNYSPGKSPAETLFEAKLQYLQEMPHNQTAPNSQAIEYKILRQYTCLGLGW